MAAILDILLFTLGITLFYTLISRIFVNPKDVRAVKAEVESYREKVKEAEKQKDMQAANKLRMETLKASQKSLKLNLKPMLVSMIIFFLALGWLGNAYGGAIMQLPFTLPFFGNDIGWFWWYVIIAIPFSMTFRKLIGLE